jgi:hypothetical protein
MLGLQLCLLILLAPVSLLAPGFAVLRRFRLSPLERFCGAVGASLVILYLSSFVIAILGGGRPWYLATSFACFILLAVHARRIAALVRSPCVRPALVAFALLLAWSLLALAQVRGYGGGGWFGDWFEHYQRTQVFLGHAPAGMTLFGGYTLPARPPLVNLVASYFLAQTGDRFEVFQVCFVIVSLLVFFPCYLLACMLTRRRTGLALTVAALLALSPSFMENVTYTWTKLLAAFFVLLGTALYLRGWRKDDSTRTVLAFVSLAAGALAHYLVGPYIVFLGGHALWRAFHRHGLRWRGFVAAACLSAGLLGTWFGWSLARFGPQKTFLSNSAVTGVDERSILGNAGRIASNLLATVVPHPLRNLSLAYFDQSSRLWFLRDWTFLVYQTNVVFAVGSVGGLLALALAARAARSGRSPWQRSLARFWLGFVATAFILGVGVVASREETGLAHICLAPLVLLGLTLIASQLTTLGMGVRALLAIGLATDFALGIALQFGLEQVDLSQVVRGAGAGGPAWQVPLHSRPALANWRLKEAAHLVFFGDHFAGAGGVAQILAAAGAVVMILWLTLAGRTASGRPPAASPPPTRTT